MRKIGLALLVNLLFGASIVSAGTCLDISSNLSRYQESSNILLVQNYLFEKGYLKAKPNGYFGQGTFAAVKAYQKANGLSQVGVVGPGTRSLIKKETCGSGSSSGVKPTSETVKATVVTPVATASPAVSLTSSQLRNAKRMSDLETLLKVLYRRTTDYYGVYPLQPGSTSTELCVRPPYVTPTATATEVAVVVSPVSPCLNYADISYLSPMYMAYIPRDPSIATSSTLIGYTIQRSDYNDITLEAPKAEDKEIIKVRCNFNAGCGKVEKITGIEYGQPSLTSLSRTIYLQDSNPKDPLVITGKNLTTKNKIYLFSKQLSREYYLGEFVSTENGTKISITGTDLNKLLSCGTGCSQKLALGDYTITLKNEGGTSNNIYMTIRAYTTSAISARADATVTPKSTGVKVATLTISSAVPIKLNAIAFTSTSTSTNLPGKISNIVLKNPETGVSYSPSSLGGVALYENQSKLYDMYVDVAEVLVVDSGFITYGGTYEVTDVLTGATMYLPSKEISFTVSY